MDYKLVTFAYPKACSNLKKAIETGDTTVVVSKAVCEPRLEYGFYYFMHQSKDKTKFKMEPRFKNKYAITNPFEHMVPDYDQDINKMSDAYFSMKNNHIISRAFYKLWEILMLFDVVPDTPSIQTVHLAEAPGGFIQATALFRKKFFKQNDIANDTYHTISLKSKNAKAVPSFKNNMLDDIKQLKIWDIEDGNLMKMSVQRKLTQEARDVDFITADGGFEWKNENYQEQEAYGLLLCEILAAFRLQRKGGSFVIKIFDVFTNVTVKIISLLSCYYQDVYIYKPLMSRPSNSEKYVVCTKFNGIAKKEIDNLEKMIEKIVASMSSDLNVVDIFDNYEINDSIKMLTKTMCTEYGNEQFKNINIMMSYLNNGIFFGDEYHKFWENQKNANDFWISTFYPINAADYKQAKKKLASMMETSIKDSNDKINLLKARLKY
jgi:23S rRNA U2552 (ribose-2'-O)-methylase RlmE/FtsJ